MHHIESLVAAPVIFLAILIGFFYEIYSRRSVLFFGFLILPVGILFFWSTSFAMTAIAKIVLLIGCQTIFQNPLMSDFVKKDSRGKGAGIEKLGYVIGTILAILLFGIKLPVYAVIAIALVLGFIFTCILKMRRVSRDYVEGKKETIRVKE